MTLLRTTGTLDPCPARFVPKIGAMQPVMSRGARREAVFEEEKDRQGRAIPATGWDPSGPGGVRVRSAPAKGARSTNRWPVGSSRSIGSGRVDLWDARLRPAGGCNRSSNHPRNAPVYTHDSSADRECLTHGQPELSLRFAAGKPHFSRRRQCHLVKLSPSQSSVWRQGCGFRLPGSHLVGRRSRPSKVCRMRRLLLRGKR